MKFTYIGTFLLVGSTVLLGLNFDKSYQSAKDEELILNNNTSLQKHTFDTFLGINSVREQDGSKIKDQYQVAKYHRIFGMDSHVFTGEEIVKEWKGKKCLVDRSIPHDAYPNDKIGFNPAKGAGGFNFDEFLLTMKQSGLESIPVLAKNLLYTNVPKDSMINVWQIPWDEGGNPENPMDYKAYASFLYQFTARYGKNKLISDGGTIDPKLLKLAPNNEIKAGLDLVFAIEPGNEMDKDWFSERERATPKILAAFLSAAIDGHMGKMGEGHGILTADSSMQIAFPSPIDIKSDYVLNVLEELKELRKDAKKYGQPVIPEKNLILTAHAYPFKNGSQTGAETSDIVENTEMISRSKDFVEVLRSKYSCPIYLTETGYDKVVGDVSPIGTPTTNVDSMDSHEISTFAQAKHITRLLMSMYGAGYDKTFLFTLKDPVAIEAWGFRRKFSTSGLIRKNGDKDLAWHVVNFLGNKLAGYKLEYAYFKGPLSVMKLNNGDKVAFMYWMGTNNNSTTKVNLPLKKNYSAVSEFVLENYDNGFKPNCLDANKNVNIEVTEFPRLVILEP